MAKRSKQQWTEHDLHNQAQAAKALLLEINSDDEDLNHDMIEGETDLFETIERALHLMDDDAVIVEGCKARAAIIDKRKKAAENRIERLKGAIEQALEIAQIKSHKFPTHTVTQKAVAPKLIVTDESAIPSRFFVPQDPTLDRKALTDHLKAVRDWQPPEDDPDSVEGKPEPIEGASLSNGGTTLQIRIV